MELKLNDKPSFNVLALLSNTKLHATSSFNMNQFKFVLFVNSKDLVLLKLTHKLISNNMVLHFLMLVPFSNKPAMPVLSKTS